VKNVCVYDELKSTCLVEESISTSF